MPFPSDGLPLLIWPLVCSLPIFLASLWTAHVHGTRINLPAWITPWYFPHLLALVAMNVANAGDNCFVGNFRWPCHRVWSGQLGEGGGEGHGHHTGYQCYFITSPHLPCSAWPQGFAAVSGRSAKASFVGGFSGRPCHARLIQSKGEGQWASVYAESGQSERGGNGWVLAGWKETAC